MSDPNRAAEKAAKSAVRKQEIAMLTAGLTFQEWPKISRLNREIVITEKLDGTNAAIGIIELGPEEQATMDAWRTADGRRFRVYAQSRTRIITPLDDNFGFAAWVQKNQGALIEALGPGLHFGEWWGVGIQRGYGLTERRFSLFNTAKWTQPDFAPKLEALRAQGIAVYTVPVLYTGPWTGNYGFIDGDTKQFLKPPQDWPLFDADFAAAELKVAGMLARIQELTQMDLSSAIDLASLIPVNPRPRFAPNFIIDWLKRVGSQAAQGFMSPEGICVYHKASGVVFKVTVENDEKHKGEQK